MFCHSFGIPGTRVACAPSPYYGPLRLRMTITRVTIPLCMDCCKTVPSGAASVVDDKARYSAFTSFSCAPFRVPSTPAQIDPARGASLEDFVVEETTYAGPPPLPPLPGEDGEAQQSGFSPAPKRHKAPAVLALLSTPTALTVQKPQPYLQQQYHHLAKRKHMISMHVACYSWMRLLRLLLVMHFAR